VLARGGVVGGSSAGAIQRLPVRGAPSNNNDHGPSGYQKGFAYLRGVGVHQHVVARERLPDLADSIITRYPQLLGISEDEGKASVIRVDTGTIVGRSKGFVYNGTDPNDDGKPFLTLQPGDVYDLGARRIMARAGDGSGVTPAFVDSLFARFSAAGAGQATVLVARQGKVIANRSFGVPPQARYMPTTTVPLFSLGEMSSCSVDLRPAPRHAADCGRRRPRGRAVAATPLPLATGRLARGAAPDHGHRGR
jgi:hypothetical protein